MGGCFDSDPLHGNAERLSQPFLHRINVRGNSGIFGYHHHVDIGYPVSAFPGFFGSKRYDLLRIDTLDPGIGIGKPVSDIRQSECPEYRVGHGMGNAVGVRMPLEALRSRNFNAAQHKLPPGCEPMNVVSDTYAHAIEGCVVRQTMPQCRVKNSPNSRLSQVRFLIRRAGIRHTRCLQDE